MNDLLPCPFCGGEAHEFETEHDSEYQYQVQCRGCGAETALWSPWTAGAGQRATAALDCVKRWNRRAHPPQPSETVSELIGWWERKLEEVQSFPAPMFAEKIKQTVAALASDWRA